MLLLGLCLFSKRRVARGGGGRHTTVTPSSTTTLHQTDTTKHANKNRLPLAVAPQTNASTDICQIGPFMCTPEGRLQKAMFGGAGLFCPGFPREFAAFGALRTLEVQTASFEGDTFDDVAKVCVLFYFAFFWTLLGGGGFAPGYCFPGGSFSARHRCVQDAKNTNTPALQTHSLYKPLKPLFF